MYSFILFFILWINSTLCLRLFSTFYNSPAIKESLLNFSRKNLEMDRANSDDEVIINKTPKCSNFLIQKTSNPSLRRNYRKFSTFCSLKALKQWNYFFKEAKAYLESFDNVMAEAISHKPLTSSRFILMLEWYYLINEYKEFENLFLKRYIQSSERNSNCLKALNSVDPFLNNFYMFIISPINNCTSLSMRLKRLYTAQSKFLGKYGLEMTDFEKWFAAKTLTKAFVFYQHRTIRASQRNVHYSQMEEEIRKYFTETASLYFKLIYEFNSTELELNKTFSETQVEAKVFLASLLHNMRQITFIHLKKGFSVSLDDNKITFKAAPNFFYLTFVIEGQQKKGSNLNITLNVDYNFKLPKI
ncbi:hypothetical protein HMI55_000273 [Coelomomyces lativittatus]|nr:hypothetical protein HMI56_003991 [Coelomomyces lativittatus]KAJ1508711.1 hypothetical protein HMI55_000273 [Coelomomyces lativittatus]